MVLDTGKTKKLIKVRELCTKIWKDTFLGMR